MGLKSKLTYQRKLEDERATLELGASIASQCDSGVFYLSGELGAGKTTLVRGFLRARGYSGAVKSPTYTLVEPYVLDEILVAHLDLYRIKDPEELEYIGLEDAVAESDFIFIEWPENGHKKLPDADYRVTFDIKDVYRTVEIV